MIVIVIVVVIIERVRISATVRVTEIILVITRVSSNYDSG